MATDRPPRARWAILLAALVATAALPMPSQAQTPVVRSLDNGLKVAVLRDPRAPVVRIQILVPAGSARETAREHGAARIVASLLPRGTTSRSAAEFSGNIESLGGSIGSNASLEYATLSAVFRAADLDFGVELVADAVINPLFDDAEISAMRRELLRTLVQTRRHSDLLAAEHVWALALEGHPYGIPELGTLESVAGLTRQQLQSFHRACYRPDQALLIVAGAVDVEHTFNVVRAEFGEWKGAGRPAALPAVTRPKGLQIRLLNLPGARDAEIRLALVAPARNTPDALPMVVVNELLGAGPSSRLNAGSGGRTLRSYSTLDLRRAGGLLVLGTATRADSVGAAVERLRSELSRFVAQPPGDDEISATTRVLGRAFSIANDGVSSHAAQWLSASFYGLGDDMVERYPRDLQAVKPGEVRAAAERWLDPDHAALVVVGDAAQIRSQLERLGSVEVVRFDAPAAALTPNPTMDLSPPSPDALRRGRELVDRALVAHGGAARLKGIKDSSIEAELILYSGGRAINGTQRELRREPAQLRIETDLIQVTSVQTLDQGRAWTRVSAPQDSIIDEDSLTVAALQAVFRSDPVHLLRSAAESGTRVAWRGEEEISGRRADVIEMLATDGTRSVLFFDRDQHLLIAVEENHGSPLAGPVLRRLFGEPRAEQGIVVPHFEERLLNGQRTLTLKSTKFAFNTGLEAMAFEKPGGSGSRPRRR